MGMDPRINALISLSHDKGFDSVDEYQELFGSEEFEVPGVGWMVLTNADNEMVNDPELGVVLCDTILSTWGSLPALEMVEQCQSLIRAAHWLQDKYPGLKAEAHVNVNFW